MHKQLKIENISFTTENGAHFQKFEMIDDEGNTYTTFRDAKPKEFLLSHSEFYRMIAKHAITIDPEWASLFEQIADSDKYIADRL